MNFACFFFQEYEEALKKLRNAYFSNVTIAAEIKRANAALKSDSIFNFRAIKTAALQAGVNHKAIRTNGPKTTFLFR